MVSAGHLLDKQFSSGNGGRRDNYEWAGGGECAGHAGWVCGSRIMFCSHKHVYMSSLIMDAV